MLGLILLRGMPEEERFRLAPSETKPVIVIGGSKSIHMPGHVHWEANVWVGRAEAINGSGTGCCRFRSAAVTAVARK
jgi:hypothetical protein